MLLVMYVEANHKIAFEEKRCKIVLPVQQSKVETCTIEGRIVDSTTAARESLKELQNSIPKLLKIPEVMEDRTTEGRLYHGLGLAYQGVGDVQKPIYYHERSLEITKEMGNRAGEGEAYGFLGNDYQRVGDFKKAIHYHGRQLEIAQEVANRAEEANAYRNLGIDYFSLGDFQKAINCHERHLEIAKEAGDTAEEAEANLNLGIDYHGLANFKKAIHYHELCLKFAREVGDRNKEGAAYGNLGNDYAGLGDLKKSLRYHQLCLEIAKETGDWASEGVAYSGLGRDYESLGDFKKAINYHELHLSSAKELGDRFAEGITYGNLGNNYLRLGEFKKAIYYHELQLNLIKEVGDKLGLGDAYCNLGNDYYSLGNFKKAIHYHELHVEIAKEVGNRWSVASACCNLGIVYQSLGDVKKAIQFHELHLQFSKKIGNKAAEGDAYGNLGNCYQNLGDFKKAIQYHELDLKFTKQVGNVAGEGITYCNLGNDYRGLGNLEKALHYHELYLEITKKVGDRAGEGNAYGNLGGVYLVLEDHEKAKECLEIGVKIAQDVRDRVGEGERYSTLGETFESLGFLSEAVNCYKSSIRTLNGVRAELQFKDDWKISLRSVYQRMYTRLWRALLKQDKNVEALVAAEQGRAQALKDLMEFKYGFETSDSGSQTVAETTYNTLSSLPSNTVFVALEDQNIIFWIIQAEKDVKLRRHEISDFGYFLMTTFFEVGCVGDGVNCEDRSLDKLRDEGPADKSSDPTQPHSFHGSQPNPLKTLYELIISPIEDLIHGDELIIVPEGPLWLAPFAAFLNSDSNYLSESYRIRVIPSLTTLRLIAESSEDYHCKTGALLVGDPWVQEVTSFKLPELPCAREEVEMIGHIVGTSPLTGTKATKDEVLKRLSSVALVHIAAHGSMKTGEIALAPNSSRTSNEPDEQDFLLTMKDVLGVNLRARLVVLSCCHSGRGDIKSEGVVGIARAFLGAGARSVLVSLWAIDDDATLEFMKVFYQHLAKGSLASEALKHAMKSLRESTQFGAVKHWAPFVLIGDDVTLECGGTN